MKKLFYSFLFLVVFLGSMTCYGQEIPMQTIAPVQTVYVSFDKTTHLVFPASVIDITYNREDCINAQPIKNVPHVIRLQVVEEQFTDTIGLTVVCQNGSVFPFKVQYLPKHMPYGYVAYANNEIYKENYEILINNRSVVNIFFPDNVIYCWHGNEEVLGCEYSNNMINLGTTLDTIPESNLFVVDANFGLYEIRVKPGEGESHTYNLDNNRKYIAKLSVNSDEMNTLLGRLKQKRRNIFSVGVIKNKLEMSLANLFVYNEYLFFSFDIKNFTNIDYDIDFIKCFVRDLKTNKNSTQQEIQIDPVYSADFNKKIFGKTDNRFILVFNKFTIPDDKVFLIEMFEKGGGRHMQIEILNEYLLNTQKLN